MKQGKWIVIPMVVLIVCVGLLNWMVVSSIEKAGGIQCVGAAAWNSGAPKPPGCK